MALQLYRRIRRFQGFMLEAWIFITGDPTQDLVWRTRLGDDWALAKRLQLVENPKFWQRMKLLYARFKEIYQPERMCRPYRRWMGTMWWAVIQNRHSQWMASIKPWKFSDGSTEGVLIRSRGNREKVQKIQRVRSWFRSRSLQLSKRVSAWIWRKHSH